MAAAEIVGRTKKRENIYFPKKRYFSRIGYFSKKGYFSEKRKKEKRRDVPRLVAGEKKG